MFDKLLFISTLICLQQTLHIISTIGTAVASKLCGLKVKRFIISFGPPIINYINNDFRLEIRSIPLGAIIECDKNEENNLPIIKTVFIILSDIIVLSAICLFTIGYNDSLISITSGFKQFWLGALNPRSLAQQMLQESFIFINSHTIISTIGIVWAKLISLFLLPCPGTNTGKLLFLIYSQIMKRTPKAEIAYLWSLCFIGLYISWLFAFISFIF